MEFIVQAMASASKDLKEATSYLAKAKSLRQRNWKYIQRDRKTAYQRFMHQYFEEDALFNCTISDTDGECKNLCLSILSKT